MIAAIYARRSKQNKDSESITTQLQACKTYGETHLNVGTYVEYIDDGFSGGNTQRPSFNKLMNDISMKKYDVLICYRLDRVSRNINDFTSILNILEDNSIDFVSIKESFDTSTPMGRAMIYIASVFSQLERDTIAERIKDNMYFLAQSGYWLGGNTPYGFRCIKDTNHSRLIAETKEISNVCCFFEKYHYFKSLKKLREWTIKNYIKTRKNKNFSISTLKFILSNPVYVSADRDSYSYFVANNVMFIPSKVRFSSANGLMVYNRHDVRNGMYKSKDISNWIIGIGQHKGLIKGSDWVKVQTILQENMNHKRLGSSKSHILGGLIYCADCNIPLILRSSNTPSKTYYYYTCQGCKSSVNATKCDEAICKFIDEIIIDKTALKQRIIHQLAHSDISIKNPQTIDTIIDSLMGLKNIDLNLQRLIVRCMIQRLYLKNNDIEIEFTNL